MHDGLTFEQHVKMNTLFVQVHHPQQKPKQ